MKKLALAAALAALSAFSAPSVLAANVTDDVSVTVNLTSACTMTTPTAITVTYTSFGAQVVSPAGQGTFTVTCTSGMNYSVGFDSTATPAATKAVGAAAANNNLTYTLSLNSSTGTGNGTTPINHRVIATVDAGQSGTCATGSCTGTAETHAVFVVY